MSRAQRDKGRRAEAEARALYEAHGFTVRGLEATGDHLAIGHGLVIHSEVKRQEVLRLPLWTRQAMAEKPAGSIPVVAYRRSREPWKAITPAEPAATWLNQLGYVAASDYYTLAIGDVYWTQTTLERLLKAFALRRALARPQEAVS